ncbi:exported hypothetical protein [Tenacibaculum maritimum]|uniref:hypothetical protein n=1 Tax=Tenacibaculum maritimum TaxID=107401 RepID=UPI0012E4ACCF|nr:hypothetical protein [Tenacibaculum maritimum]CAA0237385.1 exported hypothetical protein [Tenacibaculum maritimum]
MKHILKLTFSLLLTFSFITSCTNDDLSTNTELTESQKLEQFAKATSDFNSFQNNFQNYSENLNWDTAFKFVKEETGSWVIQIENKDKNGNLFLMSNGKSFYQDLSNIKTEIINYSVNSKEIRKIEMLNSSVKESNLMAKAEPCTMSYAAGCAAMGILVGGGPGGLVVFAGCMLTCD